MTIKTSKDAVEFAKMIDAITEAIDNHDASEPFGFLETLHKGGFMVVSADAFIVSPAAAWLSTDPDHTAALQPPAPSPFADPSMPVGPDGRPDLHDDQPF